MSNQIRNPYADWLERRAAYLRGLRQPDPRDDELRARGVELLWQARIRRRVERLPREYTSIFLNRQAGHPRRLSWL